MKLLPPCADLLIVDRQNPAARVFHLPALDGDTCRFGAEKLRAGKRHAALLIERAAQLYWGDDPLLAGTLDRVATRAAGRYALARK